MSSVLKEWPAIAVRTKYDWDLWLNGEIHKLVSGIDFTCKVDVMRINIYRAARGRNQKVKSSYIREDNSIIVQRIEQEPIAAPVSAEEFVDSIKLVEVPLPPIKKEKKAAKKRS
tara:strand:- start:664 stop:1005 length:342 start_codon:yes stop_codon:yes gene_type:complete